MTSRRPRSPLHEHVLAAPMREGTRKVRLKGLDQFLAFAGEDPRGWTRPQAAAFYRHLREAKHPRAADVMVGLRDAAAALGNGGWADLQIAPGRGAAARAPLTQAQLTELLRACRGGSPRDLRDLALIVLGVEAGLQRTELARVTWADFKETPYPRVLDVPLSDTAIRALAPWRTWLAAQRALKGTVVRALTRTGALGGPVTPQATYPILDARAAETDAGLVSPGALRLTFVRSRLAAGVAPGVVSQITGTPLPGARRGEPITAADAALVRAATPLWLTACVAEILAELP